MTDSNKRSSADAHRKRVWCASSDERERVVARSRVRTRKRLLLVGGRGLIAANDLV